MSQVSQQAYCYIQTIEKDSLHTISFYIAISILRAMPSFVAKTHILSDITVWVIQTITSFIMNVDINNLVFI